VYPLKTFRGCAISPPSLLTHRERRRKKSKNTILCGEVLTFRLKKTQQISTVVTKKKITKKKKKKVGVPTNIPFASTGGFS